MICNVLCVGTELLLGQIDDTNSTYIGRQLVDACIAFARQAGYEAITLWTNHELDAARHIYAATGFVHTDTETHVAYGTNFVSETWNLDLRR